ncbi:hypothetical protein KY285_033492 [Solanum tuberosum]|nr:hypothetical protein KY289_033592 [Solanum tuberosum]KAH0648244.1 hypothetical protein KY285_033492 [Solanum tuberosum]
MFSGLLPMEESGRLVNSVITGGQWKLENIPYPLPQSVIYDINQINIPHIPNPKDKPSWALTANGSFTTSSMYHHIKGKSKHKVTSNKEFNWIWKLQCPNKIKFFLWLSNHRRIPTSHHLHMIGINISPNCHICGDVEIDTHIFIECPKSLKLWGKLGLIDQLKPILDKRETDWLSTIRKIKNFTIHHNIDWNYAFPYCVWSIWLNRNYNFHNGKKDNILTSLPLSRALEFFYLGLKDNVGNKTRTNLKWVAPENGFKLNTDSSFNYLTRKGGAGGVLRDTRGSWITGFSAKINVMNALHAEILALLMGLRMADRHKALLQRLANPQITLRRREQNQVADRLAKEAIKLKENIDFVEWLAPPMFIMKNIDADKEGVTFIRHDMPPSSPISLTLVDNVESIPVFCIMERPTTSLFSTNNLDAGKKGANFQTFDILPPSSDSTDLVANLPSIQANCNASSHLDCMDAYYI